MNINEQPSYKLLEFILKGVARLKVKCDVRLNIKDNSYDQIDILDPHDNIVACTLYFSYIEHFNVEKIIQHISKVLVYKKYYLAGKDNRSTIILSNVLAKIQAYQRSKKIDNILE